MPLWFWVLACAVQMCILYRNDCKIHELSYLRKELIDRNLYLQDKEIDISKQFSSLQREFDRVSLERDHLLDDVERLKAKIRSIADLAREMDIFLGVPHESDEPE